MQTMTEFHSTLTDLAAKAPREVRKHHKMQINEIAHQGDVYLVKIAKRPKAWATETTRESRQVALGNTTGSRHCADGDVRVFWPESKESAVEAVKKLLPRYVDKLGERGALVCLGPVVEAREPWALTHPEHAHHELPAGCYLTVYQLDRRTMREVRD